MEIGGTGLTINKQVPECDEAIALRHPQFGFYKPEYIAGFFVQGHLMGPPVKAYETIDYIVWFLSSESSWLPNSIKRFLIEGMKKWNVWQWTTHNNCEFPFKENKNTGKLFNAMYKASKCKDFRITKSIEDDIRSRFECSKEALQLSDSVDVLYEQFIKEKFIYCWISDNKKKRK